MVDIASAWPSSAAATLRWIPPHGPEARRGEVMVVYRRSEEEMPARREEYEHAVEEGISSSSSRTRRRYSATPTAT